MKKLLLPLLLVLSVPCAAQQTIQATRTTHLLNEPNQATFDHNQVAQAGEELFVWEYHPKEYYRVRYKFTEYYVYYPYFRDAVGIDSLAADLKIKSDIPLEKRYTTPARHAPARTIHTGPRGGRYYINKNGNKTYIKQ